MVICKNYKFGYQVRFRIFDFYVFFNFGYGSEIGNFAEVYPHFLSLLFFNHMVISQGYRAVLAYFFSLCCDRRNSRNQLYIYAECEELGSTILSKNPTSGKYHIAKIAIWYYRGGSCSSVYWDLGINRKMGLGNLQQDENLMREYCDERQYC